MKPILTALLCAGAITLDAAEGVELPQFIVPGHEADMKTLQELHSMHHDAAFSDCTLWDIWLPQCTLWASEGKRAQYRASLLKVVSVKIQQKARVKDEERKGSSLFRVGKIMRV